MGRMGDDRPFHVESLEFDAEILVAHQLDLVAQIERQLRAVHQTMRQIEQLRSAKRRAGPALSNGEKATTLKHLSDELAAIDQELSTQHESCVEMQSTVDKMRGRLRAMRHATRTLLPSDDPESPNQPTG
jgi:chaperonin cofactor prefoldin